MLDACYQAKRIRELLPPLPQGVTPSYIQYLDNIHALEKQGIQVKISDISDVMNLPRPGVTRTVKEMETKGYLRKILPRMTDVSLIYPLQKKEENCHRNIMSIIWGTGSYLSEISEEEADCMIRTIEKFYQIMCERRNHYDK